MSPRYSLHLLSVFIVTEIHECHNLLQRIENGCSQLLLEHLIVDRKVLVPRYNLFDIRLAHLAAADELGMTKVRAALCVYLGFQRWCTGSLRDFNLEQFTPVPKRLLLTKIENLQTTK